MKLKIALASALLFTSITSIADEFRNIYIGAGIGAASSSNADDAFKDYLPSVDYKGEDSPDMASFSMFAGYRLNPQWAVELQFIAAASDELYDPNTSKKDDEVHFVQSAVRLAAVRTFESDDFYAGITKLGITTATSGIYDDEGDDKIGEKSEMGWSVGAGVDFLNKVDHSSLTLNYDYYAQPISSLRVVSLNYAYHF